MLPALSRLANRHRANRRRRKIVRRLREADVVVVTHTKSGRTWLLVMISYLFHLRYGVPATQIVKFDNLHKIDPRIPKIYFTRYADILAPDRGGADEQTNPNTRFIFLFRDPRDVVVSYYFHLKHRSTPVERAHKGVSDDVVAKPLFDFVLDDGVGLPRIIALMNTWVERMPALERAMSVRYEDIHADPCAELGRVMASIGEACTDDELRRAVDFASFESLREKEGRGFFVSDRLRPTDGADPDAFKVRRGKIGGYRDYFDADQLAVIDGMVAARLSPVLGYHGGTASPDVQGEVPAPPAPAYERPPAAS